ncbi:putative glutamine amidotransferase [Bacilli bacterium PM5-3]|nr:putative glutamine amidotransferase [Bacilli bacterium PM5-3]MDH6604046.1 putative glutamine amidotransferase [Bacilli bacterium PM5-9]
MKNPIIGITSNEQANFDGWFIEHYINYVKSEAIKVVDKAGGVPLIIPVLSDSNHIDRYLDLIDGLIITGGHDVYPLLYEDDMQVDCGNIHPKTDFFDIYLVKEAMKRKIPTIVICRGLQVTNVAFKGTLIQDVNKEKNSTIKHHAPEEGNLNVHAINILDNNSLFSKLTGYKDKMYVNSIHHQAIGELAPIFKVVAKANDEIIEIVELKDSDQFFIGMQFHPEILGANGNAQMMRLFKGMVEYINGEDTNGND